MVLYTVKVTQLGLGATYGHAIYGVNASTEEEAIALAKHRARRDGIGPDHAEVTIVLAQQEPTRDHD